MSHAPFILLDNARPGGETLRIFAEPHGKVVAWNPAEVAPALAAINQAVAAGHYVAGFAAYELGYVLEPRLASRLPSTYDKPLLWFGVFEPPKEANRDWLAAQTTGRAYAGPLTFSETYESYTALFRRVQGYIGAGDIYQANLTFPAAFAFAGDPLALYAELRTRAAAPHGAFIDIGTHQILSFSPELFFRSDGKRLTARPMKGTAPRGATAEEDEARAAALRHSDKDRAENLMIVDLIRNDLGRVAKTGSVCVNELFAVESYPTVHQMVSTISAELRDGATPEAILRALFPCGSVTGTPKIRAQEIIRELERSPRGVYCGAIGYFGPGGIAEFNVAIRTLTISGTRGTLGIGSAVVADSNAEAEYDECLLKARYYAEGRTPIGLIETLRWDPESGFVRDDRHLDRMAHTAAALGIPFSRDEARATLERVVAGRSTAQRARLTLAETGALEATADPFVATERWTYAISPHPLRSTDLLARHKIAWRAHFDAELARLSAETGCDHVIFQNEKGELVEGHGTNVFIRRGVVLLTPPLTSGALDGVLRRSLLESGEAIEAVLTPSDLEGGEVYLGNSLRGLVPAYPVEASFAAPPSSLRPPPPHAGEES